MLLLADNLAAIANAISYGLPIVTKGLAAPYNSGKPCEIMVERAAFSGVLGTLSVFGADFPAPFDANTANFVGDGATLNFDTAITYAAWLNYNFMVTFITPGTQMAARVGVPSAPAGTQFTVNNQGGFARITFATAPANKSVFRVDRLVAPVTLYTGIDAVKIAGSETVPPVVRLRSYDFVWARNDNTVNGAAATNAFAYLLPLTAP